MILFSLGEVPTSILENIVTCLELGVAEKIVSSGFTIRIEEMLVQFEGLFSMPAGLLVSLDAT